MENQVTKQRRIGNVAILDLREADEAALMDIKSIGNVAVVLYSSKTASLVSKLNMGNVAAVVEAPAEAKTITGQEIFSRDSFKHRTAPQNIVLTGQLIINPDVPVEELEQGLGELVVTGQLLCPQHLIGVIQPKIRYSSGQIQTYDQEAKATVGKLNLTESYLRSLKDNAQLMVIGKVVAGEVLPNDLLEQKIQKIQMVGRLVCREENAPVLLARLNDPIEVSKLIIPAGFTWVERSVVLDVGILESLPNKKLYCGGTVQIGQDVTAEMLDQALEKLVVKDVLLCPIGLRSTIARKCNLLETKAIFYPGELWLVEGELTLLASRFDYLEGKATLVVQGELTVAAEVEPRLLAERLEKVHNFGEIFCTREQMGALQARLGINEGEFLDVMAEEEEAGTIGNIAYLKL